MSTSIETNLNFKQNEALNFVTHKLASAPATPVEGQRYYNTATKKEYYWNGSSWVEGTKIATDTEASTGTAIDVAVNPKQLKTALDNKQNTLGYTAENTGNKVTTINSSSTDTQYPSAKAVNSALGTKANIASPTFTGSPKAPTATTGDSSTQIATTAFVMTALNSAVNGALIYRGNFDTTNATDYSSLNSYRPIAKGNSFRCTGSGCKIDGVEYKAGDLIIFNRDVSTSTTIITAMIDHYDHTENEDNVLLNAVQTLTNKTINANNNTITNIDTTNFESGVIVTSIGSTDTKLPTEKAVKTQLDLKANLASPTFTGTPKAPTATAGTNTTQIATTAFVQTAIANATSGSLKKQNFQNPSLTPTNGVCTWSISHTLGTKDVICQIYEVSTGAEVIMDKVATSTTAYTIKFNASASVSANTYKAILIGV